MASTAWSRLLRRQEPGRNSAAAGLLQAVQARQAAPRREPSYDEETDALMQRRFLGPGRPTGTPQSEPRAWDGGRTVLDDMSETRGEGFSRMAAEQWGPRQQILDARRAGYEATRGELLRAVRSRTDRELTPEEYAALTPQQKAAVQFNTGLLAAREADQKTGGNKATRDYLAALGINRPSEDELNEYLRLDRLITDDTLAGLADQRTRTDSASSLRYARGDRASAGPTALADAAARSDASRAARALTQQITSTGQTRLGETTARPGFGSSPRDQVIQLAFLNMVDSRLNLKPQDIADGLASLNAEQGTDVTLQEVWDYVGAHLEAAQLDRQGRGLAPEADPFTGEPFTTLDVAEIRRRYGL